MVWNEITTPLSVDNLNNLESRITAAAANVNNGKALVADAITDMGVPAAGSDTFEQLDTKIRDIPQQKIRIRRNPNYKWCSSINKSIFSTWWVCLSNCS